MAGLLRRAQTIRNTTSNPSDSDIDDGISSEERAQIAEQIEEVLKRSGPSIEHDSTAFRPKRRGFALPALVNASAVLLIAVAAYAVPFLLGETDTNSAAGAGTIEGAEGMVVGAVQEEAQASIREREEEIARIQGELVDADRSRAELERNMEEELQAREQELRRAFASELEAERRRLDDEGLSSQAIEEELAEIEQEQESRIAVELEAEREQAEAQLRERAEELERALAQAEAQRSALIAEVEGELEGELSESRAQFAALQDREQEYELVSSQIAASYEEIAGLVAGGTFQRALVRLGELADYLEQPAFEQIPRLSERRETELLTVDAIGLLLREQMEANEAAPDHVALEHRLEEREEQIRSLTADIESLRDALIERDGMITNLQQELEGARQAWSEREEQLTQQVASLEQELEGTRQALSEREAERSDWEASANRMREELSSTQGDLQDTETRLQELVDSRNSLTESFDRIVSGIASAEGTQRRSTDSVVSMLSAKLQVQQVLRSDAVRAEHPELYERFQDYLDAYGAQETARGRANALADLSELAEAIRSGDTDLHNVDALWASYTSAEEQRHMIELFRNMQRLVSQ